MSTWGPEAWQPISTPEGAYCSPACGAGCTKIQHDQAHCEGHYLAKRLGHGWTYRVWENLGWHYSAVSPCGRIKVHYDSAKNYTAFLGEPKYDGGKWVESAFSPRAVIAVGRAELAGMGARFDDLDYCPKGEAL